MEINNIFKASSVELAIKAGLEQLNLSEEEAEIEVISAGGIFSKAQVKISAKELEAPKTKKVEEKEENEEELEVSKTESFVEMYEKRERNEKQRKESQKSNYERRERSENTERERFDSEEKKIGKEFLEGILSYMPAQARVDAKQFKEELCFYIGGEEASYFIGHRGETLDAIQYLVSQFVNKNKNGTDMIRVTVDADFYRERRKKTLTALANKLAKNAFAGKKEIALEPMNSYERRIIHFALQDNEECTTRSDGEGKERHIVIVPKCEIISYGLASDFRKKGPTRTKSYGYEKRKF